MDDLKSREFCDPETPPTTRRAIAPLGVVFAFTVLGGSTFAATPSSLPGPAVRDPGPVVFETEIVRTTEPLSMTNMIPPPLPLGQIRRMPPKTTAPFAAPTSPTIRWSRRPTPAVRRWVSDSGVWRAYRPRRIAARPSPPARSYNDSLVLVTGRTLRCRILTERTNSVEVELANGATVDFPKARIAKVIRKKPSQ